MSTEYPLVINISDREFDLNQLVEQVTLPGTGAVVLFTGVVRAETTRGNRETSRLEFEAYIPMAEKKMNQVAKEIRQRWPEVQGIAITQRIGHAVPGDVVTVIACAAAHRDNGAFEAARYGIDRLKEIVPVWKKEIGPSGEEWVSGDYKPKAGE